MKNIVDNLIAAQELERYIFHEQLAAALEKGKLLLELQKKTTSPEEFEKILACNFISSKDIEIHFLLALNEEFLKAHKHFERFGIEEALELIFEKESQKNNETTTEENFDFQYRGHFLPKLQAYEVSFLIKNTDLSRATTPINFQKMTETFKKNIKRYESLSKPFRFLDFKSELIF